jgi:signal peptidase I
MTTTAVDKKKNADSSANPAEPVQSVRETVESIVVAFILAFLFRAFVAEAFVIPTGSMAPTLMGAHKDIVCEHCGKQYQSSASNEFDSNSGALTSRLVVASTCPTCRGLNAFDLENNANHATFSGDRILVSKFDYVLHDPERWDVIVFKYPKNARMNYIKRLVGLPGETLRIHGGDVYVRRSETDPWTITRKPPHKIQAMRQIVADTKYQPKELVGAGWPSLWQPTPLEQAVAPTWKVTQAESQWSAELTASGATQWLRYYHKFLTSAEWEAFESNKQLPAVDPMSSRLITDYQAYNTSYTTSRGDVYDRNGQIRVGGQGKVRPYYALDASQIWSDGSGQSHSVVPPQNDSEHWVGDLAGEFEVKVTSDTGTLSLMLVEQGVEFRCDIDIATGKATLQALGEGQPLPIFTAGTAPATAQLTAATSVQGRGEHRLEIANFDDQIVLWANGKLIEFNAPAHFSLEAVHTADQRRPYWTPGNPLDAAPVAIGGQGLAMMVERAKVWRDIYYIAIDSSYTDFAIHRTDDFIAAIPDKEARNAIVGQYMERSQAAIQSIYAHPEWWSKTSLFGMRGERVYALADDHYFPMGDNSAQSLDARAWDDHNYVEQRFMLGKALLVFWPHYWNRPIPFFPNFSRMGLIR